MFSPACTELGRGVILLSLRGNYGTWLQISASECAMISIVAARSRYQLHHPDVPMDKLVIYVTTRTHSLGLKAGLVLGLPVYALPVRAEDNYSLRGEHLREVMVNDRAKGKHPFVISETHHPYWIRQDSNLYPSRYCRNDVEWRDRQH